MEVPFAVKNAYLTQAKQDQLFASDKIDASQPNTMLMSVVWEHRAVSADWHSVLVLLHPPDQNGRQGRVELWQKQGPDAGEGPQQDDVQGRGRR